MDKLATYDDFMERVDAGKISPSYAVRFGMESNSNLSLPLILVITCGLVATGGLYFIHHRRSKED